MAATPKCQAKNPMLCHDPRCPEKRYNLKFSMEAMALAKEHIKELKEQKQYQGFAKEEADLNYRASVDWYNELLADSRITGDQGIKWIEDIDARYNVLANNKKELEEQIDTMHPENNIELLAGIEEIEEKIKELRSEYSDAYHAYYATFKGQKLLFSRLKQAKNKSTKSKIEIEKIYDQIIDGQNLHKQQIISMIIVDRKNAYADLPIEVDKAIDLKVLNESEKKEFKQWNKENPEVLKTAYVSIKQSINSESEIEWRLRATPNDEGIIIPDYVAKALYVMPVTTYRGDFIKLAYRNAERIKNNPSITTSKSAPSYQDFLAQKYDYDVLIKFENRLKK